MRRTRARKHQIQPPLRALIDIHQRIGGSHFAETRRQVAQCGRCSLGGGTGGRKIPLDVACIGRPVVRHALLHLPEMHGLVGEHGAHQAVFDDERHQVPGQHQRQARQRDLQQEGETYFSRKPVWHYCIQGRAPEYRQRFRESFVQPAGSTGDRSAHERLYSGRPPERRPARDITPSVGRCRRCDSRRSARCAAADGRTACR